MFRLINIFLTSFLVMFFAISLIYSQAITPSKRQHHAENKKGHLAVTSSSIPVSTNKN